MSTQRRNDFLRVGWSDEEESDRGYDSEAAEQSKGRAAKRRKLAQEEIPDNEDEDNGDDDKVSCQEALTGIHLGQQTRSDKKDGFHHINSPSTQPSSTSKPKSKPLDKTPKKDKTGVIYLSSLPPYLKPSALKTFLHQRGFSPIARIFLTPAIPFSGGAKHNKRKTYTDGWVEFASKKTAKICAETLNATIVGGRKGGWYHDDIWNIKYLRGFKWEDLMEQVQRERSEREARRRLEDARARKEDKVLLAGIEKGKVMEGIRKKREQKARKNADGLDGAEIPDFEVRRVFKQNEVRVKKEDPSALGENTKRILGKIF
jgi:ESF2/ABP1 family protein